MDRNVLNGLLAKLGVEDASKLATVRATKKAQRRIEANGIPKDTTLEELAVLAEIGIDTSAYKVLAAKAEPKAAKAEPKGEAPQLLPYRLGTGQRVELMTSDKAKGLNVSRKDGQKWALDESPEAWEAVKTAASKKAAELEEIRRPADEPKAPKGKAEANAAAKAEQDERVAKRAKAEAKAAGAVHRVNGSEVFRGLFPEPGASLTKEKAMARMEKAGIRLDTAAAYITWAKRDPANKVWNPFGFRITEAKTDKGVKVLTRE